VQEKLASVCAVLMLISICRPFAGEPDELPVPAPMTPLTAASPANLSLTLNFARARYPAGEPVTATVTLVNAGAGPVLVNPRLASNFSFAPAAFRDLVFVIRHSSGKPGEFRYRVKLYLPKAPDFIVLAAGESVAREVNLTQAYGLGPVGEYAVYAIYQNQSDPGDGRTAWKGEVRSNEGTLTLEP
jgi:hypothetical protein